MKSLSVCLFLFLFSISASAKEDTPAVDMDVLLIKAMNEGARAAKEYMIGEHHRLKDGTPNFERVELVYQKIESGDALWLEFFPFIRLGSDAGYSLGLNMSIAYALANNPKATIRAIDRAYEYRQWRSKFIYGRGYSANPLKAKASDCSKTASDFNAPHDNPDITWEEAGSLAIAELDKRINALSKVTFSEPELAELQQACLANMVARKSSWEERIAKERHQNKKEPRPER